MAGVITFEGYRPVARFDGNPWTQARIEEAPTVDGVYAAIETIALSSLPGGVDVDPTHPAERSLTTENATGSGLWYRVVFIDATGDESLPTVPVQNTVPTIGVSSPYVNIEELKRTLTLMGTTFADWDVPAAIAAAQAAIHSICGRRFDLDTTADTVRKYRPQNSVVCLINDLIDVTSVETDQDGDGVHERLWDIGTECVLEPANAISDGWPYTRLELGFRSSVGFPFWAPQSVKVTGKFGWPEVPDGVYTAATMLATQLLKRMREAPFGVQVAVTMDAATAVRIARSDPHIMVLLTDYVREKI